MTKTSTKRFTVSDGKMMLYLEPAEEGGYVVTSPLDPELITEAETVEEAFEMAYDAAELLAAVRAERAGGGASERQKSKIKIRSAPPLGKR
jgi:predicted RNase H-like HicB family nuclease